MISRIKEIFQYKDMISNMVAREFRGKYKGSVLGFLWTLVNPLCQIVIYTIVFSQIFRSGIEMYFLYLITGMFPWMFFSTSVIGGSVSIRGQGEMVKKIYFPREVLPISGATFNFVNMLLCFIVVFGAIIVTRWGVNLKYLCLLPFIMIIEYMFTVGISLIVAAVTVYFRDMEHIISVVMMAWVYLTPVMFERNMVPEYLYPVFSFNPMTPMIEMYHSILYYKTMPDIQSAVLATVYAIGSLIIGGFIFRKLEGRFAEEL